MNTKQEPSVFDDKLAQAINKITKTLKGADLGLSIGQIQTATKLSNMSVKTALKYMNVEFDGFGYLLKSETVEPMTSSQAEVEMAKPKTTKPRSKPFTPNPTRGYEVQKGKVKIFLDRRASSKVLTLTVQDLKELVMAVEKSDE